MKKRMFNAIISIALIITSFSGITQEVQATTSIQIGDYIQFGTYYDEPILWRVIQLDEEGDPLLFSEYIICFKAFDAGGDYHPDIDFFEEYNTEEPYNRRYGGSSEWENSNIRQWLSSSEQEISWIQNPPTKENLFNGVYSSGVVGYDQEKGFLADENFTIEERTAIKPIIHKVMLHELDKSKKDGGSDLNKDWYKNITDTVFLLSDIELIDYVDARSWEYTGIPTANAIENSMNVPYSDSYWLRSFTSATSVHNGVNLGEGQFYAALSDWGIRPAMYLGLSFLNILEGEGTFESPYIVDRTVLISDEETTEMETTEIKETTEIGIIESEENQEVVVVSDQNQEEDQEEVDISSNGSNGKIISAIAGGVVVVIISGGILSWIFFKRSK